MSKEDIITELTFHYKVINPITKIIQGLEKREYRDCDIKFLDEKLNVYVSLASETLGLDEHVLIQPSTDGHIMNEYNRNKYLDDFNKLLKYFKSFQ